GFNVNLASDGQSTATGVQINDPLPGGTGSPTPTPVHWTIASQSGASPACSITGSDGSQVLACGPQSMAAGTSISVHVTATTSAAACGQYDNTATFTSTNAGSGQAQASAACLKASIHITKTAEAAAVNAGDPIGCTVTVSNSGPGTAEGVTLTDLMPAGVAWSIDGSTGNPASFALSGGSPQQLTLAGQPISLASGGSLTVHVTAQTSAQACATYDNTASVTTTNDGSDQAEALITCNQAHIHITKTADAASVDAGDPIGFTVTITNPGAGTAKGVTLTDPMPTGVA